VTDTSGRARILIVTGMSGAGRSTALRTLEDIGWEAVDNLPLQLFDRLLSTPAGPTATPVVERPLAVGIDTRTRDFNADRIVRQIMQLRKEPEPHQVDLLFLDCADSELARRFSETRRRHPLAQDRPAVDGIARERELLAPLRRRADHLIDTTDTKVNGLQREIRTRFSTAGQDAPTLSVVSFGYSGGVPRNADLVFDMRFLRNPHWDEALRPLTGLSREVAAYIAADPAYDEAVERIVALLTMLLPRYATEGRAYLTIAFGCTGGRHRSVHLAETIAGRLRENGFSPTVVHRDLEVMPQDVPERVPQTGRGKNSRVRA
jgi:UPF0042 nucleotide-binding protein